MSQHKSISKRQGSPYHTVDDDGVLDRLKFINKEEEYQVYGKPIPSTLVTNDIQNSESYKTFVGISTGLIPPKKGRGKGAQGTKATVIPKKATSASKKKKKKKKVSIRDESSDEESEEQEERIASKRESRFQHQSGGSSEGVGLRPEVLDEPTGDSADSDEGAEEKPEDIPWVSTDDDESENDNEEDDVKGVAEMNIAEVAEEENTERVEEQKDDEELKADEEKKGDDQAGDKQVVVPVSTTQKETPNMLQSTSSHSVSSNYGNQFINSPNASLIAPPLPATKIPSTQVSNSEAVKFIVQRFTELKKAVKELKQVDYSTTILALIKSQVPSVVKDYLGSSLPNAFKKVLQSHTKELKKELSEKRNYKDVVKEALKKTPSSLGQSSSQGQSAIQAAESLSEYELKKILYEKMHKSQSHLTNDTHQDLYDALTWSMLLDEATTKGGDNPDKILKKRDRGDDQDEDPSAGPNQGMKKRRIGKDAEPSKKTSTTKESSKGKSSARKFKSGKYMTVKESVEEPIFEIASDNVEQTFDDEDWFKKAPRPETLDLDRNTFKTIDDTLEQSWFNEMVQSKKPPLTFDELMSIPIDFSSFAMNRLKLNKITREVLVVPVFNLLKGHKSPVDMSKPLALQDKESRLRIPVEFFFNNDLEYLKAGNKERTPVIISCDKDDALGISHWDLHLNEIEDMLLLIAQNKLLNLDGDVIVDFVTALKLFTRGFNVKNRVEDVQLGVESYQRKLNLTKPQRTCQHISVKEPYTPNYDLPGITYEEKSKKKRLMRVDEIHKFCDGTLQSVHKILRERLLNLSLVTIKTCL
ncbi:hypothetical protein Tco_0340760 [Tanacetum coccineum]